MTRLFATFAIVCLLSWSSPARAERPIYAISIGHNGAPPGESALSPLRYADDDAIRMHDLLSRVARKALLLTVPDRETQARFPGYAGASVRPTLENLRRALAQLRPLLQAHLAHGETPILFVTFSGHGGSTSSGELALTLEDAGLTRHVLYEEILEPQRDVMLHLVVDACRAGGVVGVRGAFDREVDAQLVDPAPSAPAELIESGSLARFPNVGALVAASADQSTHEWSRTESGVFTHELVSALLGAADVNGDLRVEYSEVEAFVASANRTLPDPRAAPRLIARAPASDMRAVLMETERLKDTYLLRGTAGRLEHFSVVLESGVRWLEAHPERDMPLALAVPQGVGKYVQTEALEAALPVSSERAVAISSLRLAARAAQARGRLDEGYSRELFRTAYGPVYYRGYVDRAGLPSVRFQASPRTDTAAPEQTGRKRAAVALWGTAAALTLATGVSGGLSLRARREFDDTGLMGPALSARDDYHRYGVLAAAAGSISVAAWIAGGWLWRKRHKHADSPRAAATGGLRW